MKKTKKLITAFLTLALGVSSTLALSSCDETYTTEETDALVLQLQTAIDGNKTELDGKIATLTEAYRAKDAELLEEIEANETAISALQAAYEAKVAELTAADATNAKAIADLTAEYNAKVAELDEKIAEANATIASNKTELEKQVAELLKVHTHEWGEAITIKKQTCEDDGFFVQYCQTCGEDKLTVVEANGEHEWYNAVELTKATCTSYGFSMRVCKNCSASETFIVSEQHSYDVYGLCVDCDKSSSRGLSFTLNDDENSYTITGIGSCTDTTISIPSKIYGKPVTAIAAHSFRNCSSLKGVVISKNIKTIGEAAFYNCSNLTIVKYEGEKSDWKKIVIGDGNEDLTKAIGGGDNGWTGIY